MPTLLILIRQEARGKRQEFPDSRFPIPDSRFPTPDSRFPISFLQKFSKYVII
ncbi:MAG: hypothetical protein F6K65_26150 [Moorea sp. SIO3C2]|nr:hypothetical protein [Moorena sp. SIO3C2]